MLFSVELLYDESFDKLYKEYRNNGLVMALIEDYIKNDELVWQHLFSSWSFNSEYQHDAELKPIIDFLTSKVSFWYYKNVFSENPFRPLAVFKEKRSADVGDLGADDIKRIENALKFTKHNLILAFFHDVLGLLKEDDAHKLTSAKHLVEFAKETAINHQSLTIEPLKRAFALFIKLKETTEIVNLINLVFTEKVFEENESEIIIKTKIAESLEEHYKKSFDDMLPYLENLYKKYKEDNSAGGYVSKLIRIVLNVYKSKNNKERINEWTIKYTDHCCNLPAPLIHSSLDIIEQAINDIADINLECADRLRFKKQETQKKLVESLNMQKVQIKLDDEKIAKLDSEQKRIVDDLKRFNGVQQFIYLHRVFYPMIIADIEKQVKYKQERSAFVDLFNHMEINEENEIVYESSKATPEQKKEHAIMEQYKHHCVIAYDFILSPFVNYLKFDQELKELLKDIIDHNLLVQKDSKLVYESICDGLNKKTRSALTKLLPMFEESCRLYIKSKGVFPVIRKGGKEHEITFTEMFIHSRFRNIIVDLLGEDLVQAMDYIACKPAGSKIRNRIAHKGLGDDTAINFDEMALFFYLIKAYCLGYDNEINMPS